MQRNLRTVQELPLKFKDFQEDRANPANYVYIRLYENVSNKI